MAVATYVQTSFLGGEWSKTTQARFDLPEYKRAMNLCLNGLPLKQGAWTRRPGFKLGGATNGGLPARLIDFSFQQSMPYTLELTDSNLRFWSGYALAMSNDAQGVSSISSASPAKVATATAHGWLSNDTVMFNTLGANDPLLMNRQFIITKTSTTEFTLADAMTGVAIDGSTLGTFVSGNVTRMQKVTTPYVASQIAAVQSLQTDGAAILVHGSLTPQVLVPTTVASGYTTFALNPVNFIDGPYLDPPTNGVQVTPSALVGIVTLTLAFPAYDATRAYAKDAFVTSSSVNYKSLVDQNLANTPVSSPTFWVAVSAGTAIGPNGFTGQDVGRHVRLYSEPQVWAVGGTYTAGNVVAFTNFTGGISYYTCLSNNTGALTNQPGVSLTTWGVNPNGARWTWGKITGLSNLISGTIAGVAQIGSFTNQSRAFDGTTAKTKANSTTFVSSPQGSAGTFSLYLGQNYAGASDQAIAFATVIPSTDQPLANVSGISWLPTINSITMNLRGKASAPSTAADGTFLGTSGAILSPPTGPITIVSSDTTTAWKYVWIEYIIVVGGVSLGGTYTLGVQVAQEQFFNPPGSGSSTGCTLQILGDPLLYTTPVRTWRLGLFSGTTGYPACGTYHEGRIWLSGAVKNRIDASRPNQVWASEISFAPTKSDGTVTDASGIAYTFNSSSVNSIQWMKPDQQGIICGTEKGEWLVQATVLNQPLSPTNIQAHPATKQGSSVAVTALPVYTEHTIVFIQRYARQIIEYFADVYSGKFSAPDISAFAEHLSSVASPIVELAYQQNMTPVVWARTLAGQLLGCTYQRDSLTSAKGPEFNAWHQHTLGSGRSITSMSIGPSPDGTLDSLAVVTAPVVSGDSYHVCFLNRLFEETDTLLTAAFLDEAVVPSYYQNIVMNGLSTLTLDGLWHLNGLNVDVWAGGLDCGTWPVSAGRVVVPIEGINAPNALLTSAYISSFSGAMPILVGFTYTSKGQILRPATPDTTGTRLGVALGKTRRSNIVALLLSSTQGISVGTNFTDAIGGTTSLQSVKLKSKNGDGTTLLPANQLFTGVTWQPLTDAYSLNSMLCWQITRPFPATVGAIGATIETADQ